MFLLFFLFFFLVATQANQNIFPFLYTYITINLSVACVYIFAFGLLALFVHNSLNLLFRVDCVDFIPLYSTLIFDSKLTHLCCCCTLFLCIYIDDGVMVCGVCVCH